MLRIAEDVAYEDFLREFDGQRVEWINGVVIEMSPVSSQHSNLSAFLITLLNLLVPGGGQVHHDPMIMRVRPDLPARAPDIAVILPENTGIVRDYDINGPADLVIEIVSADSHRRDRVEKFREYEQGGVPEYWVLDPIRREALFYQRNSDGLYEIVALDENGFYHSRILPDLRINPNVFWQQPLPSGAEIIKLIDGMTK